MITDKKMAVVKVPGLALIALIICLESLNILAGAQNVNVTVLYPKTLNDSFGNTADQNSTISFVDPVDNQKYKSEGKTASDIGAIGLLYDLVESIVQTSLPGDFPFELVSKIKDGRIDIGNDWQKIALDYLGYVIAVVVGIVFILVFPIVGMCFCCCRCCGRCGGKRVIKAAADVGHGDKCGRRTALCILTGLTTMALVGSILMFVTNNNLSTSLEDFHDQDVDKIDDILAFFNSTVQQAEKLVLVNFNFTLDVLFRDLNNIGFLLGIPIRDRVLANTGLGHTYDSIDDLETDANSLNSNLQILQAHRIVLLNKCESFHNFTINMSRTVENLATKNQDFDKRVPNRTFVTDFNATQLPYEDTKILSLGFLLSQGISSLTAESKQNLIDIPERVQNETLKQRNDLKTEVDSYRGDVSKIIDDLKSMKDDVFQGINFDSLKEDAKKYTNTAKEYNQYRFYAGLGLACIMTVTVLLLALGILFGVIGSSTSVDPAQRGSLSNAGGNMLVAGPIITFIFGWLMMLVTTALFAAAAPAEKFVCGAVQDLSVFDKLVDEYKLFGGSSGNGSWLGDKVYSGKSVVLQLSKLMESCRNDKTVYEAFKMEEANVVNLSDITDYKKKFNIEDKLGSTIISFDNINITTGPMMNFVGIMKNFDSTMEYNVYNSTLSVNPVEPSKMFLERLINFTKSYSFATPAARQEFENAINLFNSTLKGDGAAVEKSINEIQKALENIRQITQQPPTNTLAIKCDELEISLKDIEQNLSTNAGKAFNVSVKDFETRLTKILDTFIGHLENAVKNEIGACLPMWNMYSDVVVYGVCRSMIGALGGWWCAIGWTIFFLTMSVCASVKLSKHFRRMKYSTEQSKNNVNGKKGSKEAHHFQNKVYHSDVPNGLKSY